MVNRTKEEFFDIGDIGIIFQYLYLSPENKITFKNSLRNTCFIRMDEDLSVMMDIPSAGVENLLFDDHINLTEMLSLIGQLKDLPALSQGFKTRWEEIKAVVRTAISLNKIK